MSTLKFKNVDKIYPNNVQAVFDFNLDVDDKEFVVFVGPSGCGKSTTLRMIAGLEEISGGEIYIDDVLINEVAPKDRNIAMVFQNYALYPHMTVFENMAFSLNLRKEKFPVTHIDVDNPEYIKRINDLEEKLNKETEEGIAKIKEDKDRKHRKNVKDRVNDFVFRQKNRLIVETRNIQKDYTIHDKVVVNGVEEPAYNYRHFSREEIAEKVTTAAETLGLTPYLKRKPAALSGGQRQRVALGRAIVRNPKVFLMDEPLSNLDAKLRVQMRSEIAKIHKYVGATTIYVTHDQTEAMTMATKIVCMKDGYIQQIGSPKELFNNPANMFVASFIGSPAMNLIHGKYDGKKFFVEGTELEIKVPTDIAKKLNGYEGKDIVLGIRPEDTYIAGDQANKNPSNEFKLTCDISELLGRELVIYNQVGEERLIVKTSIRDDITSGVVEKYCIDLDKVHFFDTDTTKRI